jgi:hypothetical protein
VNTERVMGWVVWGLAVVVPGGLVLAALWFSFRAAKRRALLSAPKERVSQLPHYAAGTAGTPSIAA